MLAELHHCPSLFAMADGKSSVMAGMNDEAERFSVSVLTADGLSYHDEYDDEALSKIKASLGEHISWSRFFGIIREAFYQGSITLQTLTESFVEVLCRTSSSEEKVHRISFTVKKASEDVLPVIVKGLVDLHNIHSYPKDKEKRLGEISEEAEQAKIQSEQLEEEIHVLRENNTRKRRQDVINTMRLEEMKAEVEKLEKNTSETTRNSAKNSINQVINGDGNQYSGLQRKRVPLGDKGCKDYDPILLRLIKSRWITEEEESPNPSYNRVIVPFSPSELAKETENFNDKRREIVWKALDKLDEWDYNVFDVQSAMTGDDFESLQDQPNGGSLFITMYALLVRYGFLSKFNMDEQVVLNWISNVEAGYHGNPYHNSMHAADVLHVTHYILSKGGLRSRCELSDRQVFAALFAAAIHDYNHPGVNNNFHIKTQSYNATLYNDRSVLENMHVSSVFELMKDPRFDILASFSPAHRRDIRETVIETVLATDMSLHEKYVTEFKRRLGEHATFKDREDQILALSVALKMADISNCGRPLDIYIKWSAKVSDEFYMQGDRERNLGMPCSPFMDRMEPALAKGQIAFMNYIIIPFFETVAGLVPNMRIAVECAEVCKAYWMQPGKE
ncbi:3'5'-cyclic nucleotide phosphodiesterase [Trypanosoma melophagium]|uniref:3'5'-cyclic nucleotide phosphodiesterase n=1 Tax=Trypanosoma melophagium TaxID=715481 RepID=UPI00351AAE27|nr:3'5'-cyclic nucleotide phosphodiesterase [Trypanosoma melophagium]